MAPGTGDPLVAVRTFPAPVRASGGEVVPRWWRWPSPRRPDGVGDRRNDDGGGGRDDDGGDGRDGAGGDAAAVQLAPMGRRVVLRSRRGAFVAWSAVTGPSEARSEVTADRVGTAADGLFTRSDS